jgi:two-component system, sensor histidine kinase and response regulator
MAITRTSYIRVPDWSVSGRYAFAVAAALAAGAVRGGLTPLWGEDLPFLTFLPAIVLSAWAGGFWPGLVTAVLGAGLVTYFWTPPFYTLQVSTLADAIGLLCFIAIGGLISALSETMHRSRRRLEGLLQSIDEGFVVFDADWRYLYVNARAAELLREPASSMVGRAIWDLCGPSG